MIGWFLLSFISWADIHPLFTLNNGSLSWYTGTPTSSTSMISLYLQVTGLLAWGKVICKHGMAWYDM